MRLVAVAALLISAASPFARAAAVRPEMPVVLPEPKVKTAPPKPRRLVPIIKKNKAFLAALPGTERPMFTKPFRQTRLLPAIDEEEPLEEDAYFDFFLNEEAEDLP
jgi:hypothetical protein